MDIIVIIVEFIAYYYELLVIVEFIAYYYELLVPSCGSFSSQYKSLNVHRFHHSLGVRFQDLP